MIKDYINYEGKKYQLSTVKLNGIFETMVFPIEHGIVSGNEVYCYRTIETGKSMYKHKDILYNPQFYLSEEAIKKYLESKEEDFKVEDNNKKYEIYSVEADMYNCNQEYYPNCVGFQLNWEANLGFGTLTFVFNTKTKEWDYDSECMSKEFCSAVLDKWLNDVMSKEK